MSMEFPFAGLNVVDVSQGLAAPSCAMMLAQYGANVIKVEPREGDWSRSVGTGANHMTSFSVSTNLGKRSIVLDLKQAEGAAVLHRLAQRADVFIESFRVGVMQRLGFGYTHIAASNPAVIYLSVSGFGQRGPMSEQPATDAVLQAFSGMMSLNKGPEDGLPHKIEGWPIDIFTGLLAFQAVAVALYTRRESGVGRYLDTSLLQGAIGMQAARIIEYVASQGAATSATAFPVGTYRTADGFINLTVLKDSLWLPFCNVLGLTDLAAQPDLLKLVGRRARLAEIKAILVATLTQQPSDYWCAKLREIGVLNEKLNTHSEMLAHPQTEAAGSFTWVEQPEVGRVPYVNLPGMQPLQADSDLARVPQLGAHTHEVLSELGYSEQEIAALIMHEAAFEPAL